MATTREEDHKGKDGRATGRAPTAAEERPVHGIPGMQGTVGNEAVVQMLRQAGHPWARERHQHGPGCVHPAQGSPVQRATAGRTVARSLQEEEHVHGGGCGHEAVQDTGPAGQLELLESAKASPSRSIPAPLLAEAVPFFQNGNLSSARLHDNPVAQRAVEAMGARAMTVENHIFAPPDVVGNVEIMGHELSHVDKNLRDVTETGHSNGAVTVTDPGQPSEVSAANDGAALAAGMSTAPSLVAQRAVGTGVGEIGTGSAHGGQTVQRAGSSSKSDRPKRPKRVKVESLARKHYIEEPTYGKTLGSKGGGTRAHAILGPLGFWDRNSDANPRLPPAIDDARAAYPNETFIAGHLLNATFGGPGTQSKNITILTSSANSAMKSFDNPLKQAVMWLKSVYEKLSHLYCPIDTLKLGIEITVSTSGEGYTWTDDRPGKYISQFIHCNARVKGSSKVNEWINQGLAQDPDSAAWNEVARDLRYVDSLVAQANQFDLISNAPSSVPAAT